MSKYFEVSALFITFREAFEAGIIVSIARSIINKLKLDNKKQLIRQVYTGVLSGLITSCIPGIIFLACYYKLKKDYWSKHEEIFEAVMMFIACIMVTIVSVSMGGILYLREKWELKLSKSNNFFYVCFISVFRESIEAFILLTGISQANPQSLPIPGIVGILLGILLCYLMNICSEKTINNFTYFIYFFSFLLYAIGAGLFSRAFHELEEVGLIDNKVLNKQLANFKKCCNSKGESFFALLKAIFGYSDSPTVLIILTYVGYWFLVICYLVISKLRNNNKY
jgi:high-affinity iron transporter